MYLSTNPFFPYGAGIARILAHPSHGNLAVALLARRPEPLDELVKNLKSQVPGSVIEGFPSDTSPEKLRKAFKEIKAHESFKGLKLGMVSFKTRLVDFLGGEGGGLGTEMCRVRVICI